MLAHRSERLCLIAESRVRASQTGHFGEIWRKMPQNDLSARLEPGILRSDTRALTSALASHERNLLHVIIRVITRNVLNYVAQPA